ncbi:hypothetical protein EJB05_48775, partial [Eragrostis curvula]
MADKMSSKVLRSAEFGPSNRTRKYTERSAVKARRLHYGRKCCGKSVLVKMVKKKCRLAYRILVDFQVWIEDTLLREMSSYAIISIGKIFHAKISVCVWSNNVISPCAAPRNDEGWHGYDGEIAVIQSQEGCNFTKEPLPKEDENDDRIDVVDYEIDPLEQQIEEMARLEARIEHRTRDLAPHMNIKLTNPNTMMSEIDMQHESSGELSQTDPLEEDGFKTAVAYKAVSLIRRWKILLKEDGQAQVDTLVEKIELQLEQLSNNG